MKFQTIIDELPTNDLPNLYLYIEEKCVVDYKTDSQSIKLISDSKCLPEEMVSMEELIKYIEELEYSTNILTLYCEDINKQLNSYICLKNKLILSF